RNDGRSLSINVAARVDDHSLNLTVANTGELYGHYQHHSANVGLKNVCERLARLYPGASAFDLREEGGWVRATIRITDGNLQSADR
ncbi:MAG TPA: hypothetical protein VM870_04705, partial [Pyrinomonadaceae bacterium]|nr:hypothetical protein [Pyrinomonadaceae bacterium]